MGWEFCSLDNVPKDLIKDFDCGDESVNTYLHKSCLEEESERFAKIFIMLDNSSGYKLVGYYTLSNASIEAKELPNEFMKGNSFPCPAILIGKFGIDKSFQGKKLSRVLLWDVYRRILLLYKGDSAFKTIRVDTRKEEAEKFWEKQGFFRLQKRSKCFFLPVATMIKTLEED